MAQPVMAKCFRAFFLNARLMADLHVNESVTAIAYVSGDNLLQQIF
jgi:hypothetical protein